MKSLQVILMTRNRTDYLFEAIDSILLQDSKDFELIISDNSSDDSVKSVLSDKYDIGKTFKYLQRLPELLWIDHLNTIISEVTADFFMIFHDDDIMFPSMVSSMMPIIINDDSVVAVGSNAYIIKNTKKTSKKLKMASHKEYLTEFNNAESFISTYLDSKGSFPFPSYIYRSINIKNTMFDSSKGGKYCDVSFLMDIMNYGKIVCLNEPKMFYRFHNNQLSSDDDFLNRNKLIRYITAKTTFSIKSKEIKNFRTFNIYTMIKKHYLAKRKHSCKFYIQLFVIFYRNTSMQFLYKLAYFSLINCIVFRKKDTAMRIIKK